ncbi:hypothetical protein SESBI_04396 [Sesbania bispinosa]|nr:hypothetical protein SESBI_04396 [Sesbania bispinosa]
MMMSWCIEPRLVLVHGKRKVRSLFWKVRADVKRQMKARSMKKNFNFNYDPFSYSLNFDDGFDLLLNTTKFVLVLAAQEQ